MVRVLDPQEARAGGVMKGPISCRHRMILGWVRCSHHTVRVCVSHPAILSHPTPSHPIPPHIIQAHPTPSHTTTSHPIPSHPIPYQKRRLVSHLQKGR